ncbi:adenosylmethionine--8-amino-7-oxononanoate transaminase [Parasphingorhabdus sp. DH2-15]|uniref:adenosylmethionine--8-amino-7-oxononanoate transaminase n=1 Tax=Parasphingorhabdus sp. DH2-15 TaxID=3444112 RepID=UPI003F683997
MDIWHPFTQHGLNEPIPEVVSGDGAILRLSDGRELIDGIASWWVNTHGHAHPKIARAIADQAAQLDQIIFAGWTHPPALQAARGMRDVLPEQLSHIFFSDSGSTSVEVALKMAMGMWHNLGTPRERIVVMEHSYHGDTFGTMSVGERTIFNTPFEPLLFDVATIDFPSQGREQVTLDALERHCADAAHKPAAFIVEPLVLGAGGMLMYSAETLSAMYAICAAHDVPFIVDEVMTGWGRTGSMFAFQQADFVPDIICLSKGITSGALPLAVTACQQRFYDAHLSSDKAKMFFHSSSYTANPMACAAVNANLAIWRDEPVQQRIDHIAARHSEAAQRFADCVHITNIRQQGSILAMEIVMPDSATSDDEDKGGGYLSTLGPTLNAFFIENGIMLRPLGNTVYILPPYCITDEQLDHIYTMIERCIEVI